MFLDTAKIRGNTLVTHRSSFLLDRITAADVPRPLLQMAAIPALGSVGFIWGFFDILYVQEIVTILGGAAAWLIVGANIGQMKLVSADLRGSEVSGAVWGSYRHLKKIHHQINTVWKPEEMSDGTL